MNWDKIDKNIEDIKICLDASDSADYNHKKKPIIFNKIKLNSPLN